MRPTLPALFVLALLSAGIGCSGGSSTAANSTSAASGNTGSVNTTSSGSSSGGASACGAMSTGGASLNGFVPFASNSAWNQDISAVPVDPNSAAIIKETLIKFSAFHSHSG